MTDDDLRAGVSDLHEHLAATRELPVERSASRWIGEAEAVAEDLVGTDASRDVLRERLGHVRELLAKVDGTGHAGADDHVTAARRTAHDLLDRLDED